jgi:hypothetical protein
MEPEVFLTTKRSQSAKWIDSTSTYAASRTNHEKRQATIMPVFNDLRAQMINLYPAITVSLYPANGIRAKTTDIGGLFDPGVGLGRDIDGQQAFIAVIVLLSDAPRHLCSPNDPQRWAFLTYGALAHIFNEDYRSAIEWADRASEIPNCQFWTIAHKTVALAYLGDKERAKKQIDRLMQERLRFSGEFAKKKLFFLKDAEQLSKYLEGLKLAGVP